MFVAAYHRLLPYDLRALQPMATSCASPLFVWETVPLFSCNDTFDGEVSRVVKFSTSTLRKGCAAKDTGLRKLNDRMTRINHANENGDDLEGVLVLSTDFVFFFLIGTLLSRRQDPDFVRLHRNAQVWLLVTKGRFVRWLTASSYKFGHRPPLSLSPVLNPMRNHVLK